MSSGNLTGRRMLVTTAHPDDESFGPGGTLARYAAEGVKVYLACATRGEAGGNDLDDLGACEDLACKREEELRCAVGVLGLADLVLLGYRDSGMVGTVDNGHADAFCNAPVEEVAGKILDLITRFKPQVIMTSDPYGGYGHPDHIAIHKATLRAWELAQETMPPEDRPRRLYYTAMPGTLLRWAVRLLPLIGRDPSAVGTNSDIDLRAVMNHLMPVNTKVDIVDYDDVRQRARACHATQLSGPRSTTAWMPRWLLRALAGTDHFHRAIPPFGPEEKVGRDLFDGVVP